MNVEIQVAILGVLSTILAILLNQSYSKNVSLRAELKNRKQKLYSDFIKFIWDLYTIKISLTEKQNNENANKLKKILTSINDFWIK